MTGELLQRARDFESRYGPHIPTGEQFPAALAPDCGYDAAGGFSGGSAIMDIEKYDLLFEEE